MLPQVCGVLLLAGGIHHQEQMIAGIGNHQVVEDAALLVGKQRITLLVHGQIDNIDRHQRFQCRGGARAAQAQLPHVRHIEQAGLAAGVIVFLENAGRILQRHFVACERHHLGA